MQAVIFCIGLLWSEQHIEGDEIRAGLTRHGNRRFRRDAGEARRGFCSRCDKWLPLREWDSWDVSGKFGQLYANFRFLLKWSDTYKHLNQQINHRNQKQTTCLKCRTDLYRAFGQKQKKWAIANTKRLKNPCGVAWNMISDEASKDPKPQGDWT